MKFTPLSRRQHGGRHAIQADAAGTHELEHHDITDITQNRTQCKASCDYADADDDNNDDDDNNETEHTQTEHETTRAPNTSQISAQ